MFIFLFFFIVWRRLFSGIGISVFQRIRSLLSSRFKTVGRFTVSGMERQGASATFSPYSRIVFRISKICLFSSSSYSTASSSSSSVVAKHLCQLSVHYIQSFRRTRQNHFCRTDLRPWILFGNKINFFLYYFRILCIPPIPNFF